MGRQRTPDEYFSEIAYGATYDDDDDGERLKATIVGSLSLSRSAAERRRADCTHAHSRNVQTRMWNARMCVCVCCTRHMHACNKNKCDKFYSILCKPYIRSVGRLAWSSSSLSSLSSPCRVLALVADDAGCAHGVLSDLPLTQTQQLLSTEIYSVACVFGRAVFGERKLHRIIMHR